MYRWAFITRCEYTYTAKVCVKCMRLIMLQCKESILVGDCI